MGRFKPRSFKSQIIWGSALLLLVLSTVVLWDTAGPALIENNYDGGTSQEVEGETSPISSEEPATLLTRRTTSSESNMPELSLTLSVVDSAGAALPDAIVQIRFAEGNPLAISVDVDGIARLANHHALAGVVYATYDPLRGEMLRSRPQQFELGKTGYLTLTVDDSTCCLYGFVRKGDVGAEGFTIIAASETQNRRIISDPEGFFLIDGLDWSIPQQVYCINGRQKFFQDTLSLNRGEARLLEITLGSGDILLNLLPWTDEIGDSDVQLELQPLDLKIAMRGTSYGSSTNARAKFVAVPPGEYLLRVSPSSKAQTTFAPAVYPLSMGGGNLTLEIPLAESPLAIIHLETEDGQHTGSVEYWFDFINGSSTKKIRRAQRTTFSSEAPLELNSPIGACRLIVRSNQFGLGAIDLNLMPGERQEHHLLLDRDFPRVSLFLGGAELPRGWLLLQDQEGRVESSIALGGGRSALQTGVGEFTLVKSSEATTLSVDLGLAFPGYYQVVFVSDAESIATGFKYVSLDTVFEFP